MRVGAREPSAAGPAQAAAGEAPRCAPRFCAASQVGQQLLSNFGRTKLITPIITELALMHN